MTAFTVQSKKTNETYYLHSKIVELAGKRKQLIYWFSRKLDKEYVLSLLPAGYTISENVRTGLPLLKKIEKNK